MQRDIDLTIGDIVLDLKDFGFTLKQFSKDAVTQAQHTNLRFLKIPHFTEDFNLDHGVTCELTEKKDHPRETRYVAVSYCWDSFTSEDNTDRGSSLHSSIIMIEQRGKPPRAPRCPTKVLIRAIAFAASMKVPFIWIDQECVDQKDPADIQSHLNCNDKIFSQAEYKIGLLSFQLSKLQVDHLIDLELFHQIFGTTGDAKLPPDFTTRLLTSNFLLSKTQTLTRLLKSIARDPWFKRTWVFQERFSASLDMHLLLPLSAQSLERFDNSFGKKLVKDDFPLEVALICTTAAVIRLGLSAPELSRLLQEDITTREAIYESLVSLHEASQLLSGPIFAGTPFDRVYETLKSGTRSPIAINNVRNFPFHKIFHEIESCDNRIVSDRVAILSNVMGFQWRFPTTDFRSYSFAVTALMSANNYLPSILIWEKTPTQPSHTFHHSVPLSGLIMLLYHMKELATAGSESLQKELCNVSQALRNFLGRDISRHTEFQDAIQDAAEGLPGSSDKDPLFLLSEIEMRNLKRVDVIPLLATIGDIVGGIVAEEHIDNVGLLTCHGEIIVRHGIKTNQLNEDDTFLAHVGGYRWRSEFVEKFFN